jgi:hypothetical protein
MEKITEILNGNKREGIGKTGNPWKMMEIKTDSGKTATCFAPAAIGDPVQLEYNDQYKNYNVKVMTSAKMTEFVAEEKKEDRLQSIEDKLDHIISVLSPQTSGYEKAKQTAEALKPKEEIKEEISFMDDEINLDDIPF